MPGAGHEIHRDYDLLSTFSAPIWAEPLAPPPLSTTPTLGLSRRRLSDGTTALRHTEDIAAHKRNIVTSCFIGRFILLFPAFAAEHTAGGQDVLLHGRP